MDYRFQINDKVLISNPSVGQRVEGVVIDRNNEELGGSNEQYQVAYTDENGTKHEVWLFSQDVSSDE